ncbi:MAG: RidA family protein [Leadbetterella sp.]
MKIEKLSSGTPWETAIGYSRAIKFGNTIELSGTVAVDNSGELIGEGSEYIQTKFIILKAQNALQKLGADLKDVIRTRVFCTNIKKWEGIGEAHHEFFNTINPVMTLLEVSALIDPKYLVEIEFTAVIQS